MNVAGDAHVTLDLVLAGLGTIVTVAAAPAGLHVAVARPVIHDPVAPPPIERGDIVLAVGTAAASPAATELVLAAGEAGAAAVAFHGLSSLDAAPAALVRASTTSGVALLAVASTLTWGQLHTLLRTTVAAGTPPSAGHDAAPLGDLFSLANAIAAMVGGPTTIEDRESTVLAYSRHDTIVDEHRRQTILGHRVPEEWRRRLQDDGVFRRLWTETGAVRIDYPDADPPLHPRLAIAVRAGDEILGSIWVAEGDKELGADAERALIDAGPIAALHLIRWRTSEDVDRERRSALLRSVLEGDTAPEVLAESLDVDEDAFVTVLAFRLLAGEPEDAALRSERARDLIALYCESFRRKAASVAIGPVVYVLIPEVADPERARLVALAGDIIERVRGPLQTEVSAGIGATLQGLASVRASRRQADAVLQVLAGPGVVGTIESHRPATILSSLRASARRDPDLLEGHLAALRVHDAEHRTAYVETLRAYLDHFGDIPAAATSVGVHQNTFRYRLRRLLEISDVDLTEPVARLVLHLQLHLAL
jgi:hypothetical protein